MEKGIVIDFGMPAATLLLLLCLAEGALGQGPYAKQAELSETDGKVRLMANDSRPLAQALDAMQQRYGWVIDYEDPQYASKQDFVEAKGLQDKSSSDAGRRVPAGGAFAVEFSAGATPNAAPDEQKTLQIIVDAYNRSGNPGRFELRHEAPEYFDVVGTAGHDAQGKISPQKVLLDLPITLPAGERTASDTIDLICQKIAEKSHIPVSSGIYPGDLDRTKVTVGGEELPARTYLHRATERTGRRLCWRLLFDPGSKSYFINLHQIRTSTSKPMGAAKP